MSAVSPKRRYTAAEYLRLERAALDKHEFHDGEIVAMAGASTTHVRLVGNVYYELRTRLKGTPCEPFSGDLRVALAPGRRYSYPDVSVVCGPIEYDKETSVPDTILNPRVIVEVLSPSTEAYDRTTKFDYYREIPALEEYVLVSQTAARIDTCYRQADGSWILTIQRGLDRSVHLRSLQIDIPFTDLYAGVVFAAVDE